MPFGARWSTIRIWPSFGSARRSRRPASARARAPSRRCSRRCSVARATSRRRRISCWAIAAWTSMTGSRPRACRQRLPWGAGTWSVSWDTSRTTTNNPISSFDPSAAVGPPGGVLAAAAQGSQDRRGAAAVHHREEKSGELRTPIQRVGRPDGGGGQAGVLDAQGDPGERHRSAAIARARQELARQNKIRVDAGQIPPIDLVQAEAEVAQRRENLIRANDRGRGCRGSAAAADHRSGRCVILAVAHRPDRGTTPTSALLPDVDAAVASALERAVRPRPRRPRAGERARRTSNSSATRNCPTCGSRRRIAAAASAAPSSCARADSRASSPAPATEALATRSARRSPPTIRRGASASR